MTTLTLIGLAANMTGAAITFFFGYPQPSHEESVGLALSGGTEISDGFTVDQHVEKVRKRRAAYQLLSRLGLGLMFLGFAFQFVALSHGTF